MEFRARNVFRKARQSGCRRRLFVAERTIGIDITKRVFYLQSEDGRAAMHKKQSREKLVPFIANLPPSVNAMEAGCGAHHWARRCSQLGLEV